MKTINTYWRTLSQASDCMLEGAVCPFGKNDSLSVMNM